MNLPQVSRRAILLAGAAMALPVSAVAVPLPLPQDDSVFLGPLPGWLDVKARFGAQGDGRTDDTAALQAALDALDTEAGSALWFPPGDYCISRTLTFVRSDKRRGTGLNIQGAHPDQVTLRWAGPKGGAMLAFDAWYSKLGRITFDGAGTARTGLRFGPNFVTANELADLVFRDLDYGIETGLGDTAGIAETSVQRCGFTRCAKAGVLLQNFNALDWWFWHCRFEDCGTGLSNNPGAGNFHAYECLFERSRIADIAIKNTGYFSFRDNTSLNSKAFFVAETIEAGAQLSFQRNRIIDPQDTAAIRVGNLGPVLMFDNVVASRPGASGPVVTGPAARAVAMGNVFTIPAAIRLWPQTQEINTRLAARASLDLKPPALPRTPPAMRGPVISLPKGAGAAAIQALIDRATEGAVLCFAAGDYAIDRTLVLPPGREIHLVGQGIPDRTRLNWTGAGSGPVILARSPSRVRLCDLTLRGGDGTVRADGVAVESNARAGSRLWLSQTLITSAADAAYGLDQDGKTTVLMRDIAHGDSKVGVRVSGPNGDGRAVILSGASSNNDISYDVGAGARFLARDIWYETSSRPRFMDLTGTGEFALWGSVIALPNDTATASVNVDGFKGRATFLGVQFEDMTSKGAPQVRARASASGTALTLLGCHGSGEYLAPPGGVARVVRSNSVQMTPGGGAKSIADVGLADPVFLRAVTALARQALPAAHPTALAAGLGDLRLHRVFISSVAQGVWLKGA